MIKNIRHAGIVVCDLIKMTEFYSSLGFVESSRRVESGAFIEQVTGIKDVNLEWVKMTSPDGFLLELLQYHSPHNANCIDMKNAIPNQLGCSHIAFTVVDIVKVCATIHKVGGSIVNEPALSPDGRVKVAYCHDPEGVLMEIVEELEH